MNRKVFVPGRDLRSQLVLKGPGRSVYAIGHADEIVVFFLDTEKTWARAMTQAEAKQFSDDLMTAYQAFKDDDTIEEMERYFDG